MIKPYLYINILILMLAVTAPSHQVAIEIKNKFSLVLPQQPLNTGEFYNINSQLSIESIYADEYKLTQLSKNKYFFGVSQYKKSDKIIFGTRKTIASGFLKHPKVYYFVKNLTVNIKVKKQKGAKLRLPASVWRKVNKKDQVIKEREIVNNVFNTKHDFKFQNTWKSPLYSHKVSKYGSARRLPNGKSYFHSGVDFRAQMNTPIKTTAPGMVVFKGHLTVPGNLVIVYHGRDIYSRYLHLNKITVKEGQALKAGEVIGYSGQTGRVEGPHLHFEILWKGIALSPSKSIKYLNKLL